MGLTDLDGIVAALKEIESAVVVSHLHPDGDAVGSVLAMGYFLESLGTAKVRCVLEDSTPRIYRWLPGVDRIVSSEDLGDEFDTLVIVDVAQLDRIGKLGERDLSGKRIIVVDHHLAETPEGRVNFVDPTYSSCGEIIADLFEAAGIPFSKEAALCIFVALVTDTGGFRYSNTNARSHRIAARLMEEDIDVAEVCERVFEVMSEGKFQLLRRVLDRMVIEGDAGIAYSKVFRKDIEDVNAKSEDFDGLVNFVRNIEGVRVGILFRELEEKRTKVSVRARDGFNAADFLEEFGGGGHAGAAGVTMAKPLEEAEVELLGRLRSLLRGPS